MIHYQRVTGAATTAAPGWLLSPAEWLSLGKVDVNYLSVFIFFLLKIYVLCSEGSIK